MVSKTALTHTVAYSANILNGHKLVSDKMYNSFFIRMQYLEDDIINQGEQCK